MSASHHECSIRELVAAGSALPTFQLGAELTDPDSGEVLHPQRGSSPASVEQAIATAERVHVDGTWSGLPSLDRAAALRRLGTELGARAEELGRADSLDSGVPHTTTIPMIGGVAGLLELAAQRVEGGFGHVELDSSAGGCDEWRLPWGAAAVFLPWNAPTATAIMKTAEALVAGCPVILKPSEWAPHFTGAFAAAVQAADLSAGLIQILHGDHTVGQSIVGDPRVAAVSFTGGVPGGTAVAEACARQLKPVDLELSGNNPIVALPDAEPAEVAMQLFVGMLFLNGQWCAGPRRLVVPEERAGDYLAALGELLEGVTIGATADPSTHLGPLSSAPHHRRIEAQLSRLSDNGAEVHRYGKLPAAAGHFAAPAIVVADAGAEIGDEVFGPAVILRTYRDIDEAVAIANDHPYGLTAYLFGADRDAARAVGRRLRAGMVKLNAILGGPADVNPVGSFWGASGIGTFGVGEGANFFTGARFVS